MRRVIASHATFAATLVMIGILGLIKGNVTAVWAPVPKGVPARHVLTYVCAFVPIVCGVGLLWGPKAALAARVLLVYLLLWLTVFRVPDLLTSVAVDTYWSACKTAVMVAAAWVLYVWFAGDWDRKYFALASGRGGLRIARSLYGLALIPFGLAHFQLVQHTAALVPGWLPAPVAWASLFGVTFIAAGVAILIRVYARLAAVLSALQMGMFTVLVWLPVVARGSINSFQSGETLVSWVLTVAGWVVADSYRATLSRGKERADVLRHSAPVTH